MSFGLFTHLVNDKYTMYFENKKVYFEKAQELFLNSTNRPYKKRLNNFILLKKSYALMDVIGYIMFVGKSFFSQQNDSCPG